ncbi:uncharacterized protein [Antedon mediterranea]|uniref:uncharacterized protein n=1 Tax=Antedon mediterranea TaxID=105859 RepID=UPI003AF48527
MVYTRFHAGGGNYECNEFQYRCTSGQCIVENAVCNNIKDCEDNSDEENCRMLEVEDTASPSNSFLGVTGSTTNSNEVSTQQITSISTFEEGTVKDNHELNTDIKVTTVTRSDSTENADDVMTIQEKILSTDVNFEAESPNFSSIIVVSETTIVKVSTTAKGSVKDGPYKLVARLTEAEQIIKRKTVEGELLPSASEIVEVIVYDKNNKSISTKCEIVFNNITLKNLATENETDVLHLPVCHFTHGRPNSTWSTEGCLTVYQYDYFTSSVTCTCNHLTSFVVLMKPNYKKSQNDKRAISMLTNITIGMSSVFLIITLITIISIRELRNSDRYRLLRHLVIALLLVHFFFPFINLNRLSLSS